MAKIIGEQLNDPERYMVLKNFVRNIKSLFNISELEAAEYAVNNEDAIIESVEKMNLINNFSNN